MTPDQRTIDLIKRLADRIFFCDCQQCMDARHLRLLRDLEESYGCDTTAQVEAARKRHIN